MLWLGRVLPREPPALCCLVSDCSRFKEHIQDNLPRDFLTTEQFIQLRRELASVNGHSGEEAQPGDDMPTGAEDITDPAKVRARRLLGGVPAYTLAGRRGCLQTVQCSCSWGLPVALLLFGSLGNCSHLQDRPFQFRNARSDVQNSRNQC